MDVGADAIADTVVLGEVGRRFGRGEDIIGGQGGFGGGEGNGHDDVALAFELAERSVPRLTHRVAHFCHVVFGRNANASRPVACRDKARIFSSSVNGCS